MQLIEERVYGWCGYSVRAIVHGHHTGNMTADRQACHWSSSQSLASEPQVKNRQSELEWHGLLEPH